ncbi:MAG: helix-turn-helix transcriptional regulator [Clostridiales bacterium]|nr:helix-turn-helix transcriptional regulator [Clostridiales bacterium]MCD8323528.1 helix-turn-helix transcriptional regulator [Clostridiales bacterium]
MLAARGWSNKEIGAHLGISTNTVKMHISSVLRQLGIPQRKDLAQFMLK